MRGAFQLCVHMGSLEWPKTWTTLEVGTVTWSLYCRKGHPLSAKPTLAQILKYPFVYPAYWAGEGVRFGDDNCPQSIRRRRLGHETATATAAVEMVRYTDHLGFFPSIVARALEKQRLIRRLPVREWNQVSRPLYLTVKNDFVKQPTFLRFKELLQDQLSRD